MVRRESIVNTTFVSKYVSYNILPLSSPSVVQSIHLATDPDFKIKFQLENYQLKWTMVIDGASRWPRPSFSLGFPCYALLKVKGTDADLG